MNQPPLTTHHSPLTPDNSIAVIGIMTGNSLDAVDVVLTEFDNGKISDLKGHSKDIPQTMRNSFLNLKKLLIEHNGDIELVSKLPEADFPNLHNTYIHLIAETVKELIANYQLPITAIGFHGQTCAHQPPSIAKTRQKSKIYTLQIGSGQMLANLLNIPVVYDFRSDDLMNQGEGAPLAPIHNLHLAQSLNLDSVAFCNAGNTGNLTIINKNKSKTNHELRITNYDIMGWDTGPFNHFIDLLCREEKNTPFDKNGQFGKQGKINYDLLRALFNKSVTTKDGGNFLLKTPPKSSDPGWYKTIPELKDPNLSFADRLRTAEFFSAYIMAYNLNYIPADMQIPSTFLIFGGGWKNPIVLKDFKNLLSGKAKVLEEHQTIFNKIKQDKTTVEWSDRYGYSGQYMEARIFADMARCYLTQEPFTYPETTGCNTPTLCGTMAIPHQKNTRQWSRAAKNWYKP